jgi:hypothetical protein
MYEDKSKTFQPTVKGMVAKANYTFGPSSLLYNYMIKISIKGDRTKNYFLIYMYPSID